MFTSELWLQVAVDGGGHGSRLATGVRGVSAKGRSQGVTEAHVDGWRHLPPQGSQVRVGGQGGHGDVAGLLEVRGLRSRRRSPVMERSLGSEPHI